MMSTKKLPQILWLLVLIFMLGSTVEAKEKSGKDVFNPLFTANKVNMVGAPKYVSGKFGGALSFDGISDAIWVPDCPFNDEEGTMEAWVRMSAKTQEKNGTILRLDGSNPWTYHIIERLPKTNKIEYVSYDGTPAGGNVVVSGELSEGWHHVVGTYSAKENKLELFIDGVSQGTAKYIKTTCKGATLNVGGYVYEGDKTGNAFTGLIDEVCIFNIVRKMGAEGTIEPYVPDKDTGILMHFDEGLGISPSYVAPSPQPVKASAANAFCILFVGNSITRQGIVLDPLNWDHEAGMAASSEDKDFVHRLSALIQATMPDRKVEIYFDGVNKLIAQKGTVNPILRKSFPSPHLVVIQTGEHEVPGKTREAIAEIYEQSLVKPYVDLTPKPLILCTGVWSPSDNVPYGGYILDVNEAYKSVCAKYNIPFASVESFATDPTCRGFGTNGGVQWHPNDKGMKGYADSLFKAFQQIKKPK